MWRSRQSPARCVLCDKSGDAGAVDRLRQNFIKFLANQTHEKISVLRIGVNDPVGGVESAQKRDAVGFGFELLNFVCG